MCQTYVLVNTNLRQSVVGYTELLVLCLGNGHSFQVQFHVSRARLPHSQTRLYDYPIPVY